MRRSNLAHSQYLSVLALLLTPLVRSCFSTLDPIGDIEQVFFLGTDLENLFFVSQQSQQYGYLNSETGTPEKVFNFDNKKLIRIEVETKELAFVSRGKTARDQRLYIFEVERDFLKEINLQEFSLPHHAPQAVSFAIISTRLYILLENGEIFRISKIAEPIMVRQADSEHDSVIDMAPLRSTGELLVVSSYSQQLKSTEEDSAASVPQADSEKQKIVEEDSRLLQNSTTPKLQICASVYSQNQLKTRRLFRSQDRDFRRKIVKQKDSLFFVEGQKYTYALSPYRLVKRFQGKILQHFGEELVLEGFRSFRARSSAFYDFLVVEVEFEQETLFRLLKRDGKYQLLNKNKAVRYLEIDSGSQIRRSWVATEKQVLVLVTQTEDSSIQVFRIETQNPYLSSSTARPRWVHGPKTQKETDAEKYDEL